MSIFSEVRTALFDLKDEKYRDFQINLIPNLSKDCLIGIRTPELRKISKTLRNRNDIEKFLKALPHKYFEENQIHSFIIADEKDFESCVEHVNSFLPYINNWATCDQLSPKVLGKHTVELMNYIENWIISDHVYTVRFAICCLMRYYLGDSFKTEYADKVAKITSEEYYINMMRAWYFATAFAKNYKETLPYFETMRMDKWTHNKAIQKALESYRLTNEQKEYLRTLKV